MRISTMMTIILCLYGCTAHTETTEHTPSLESFQTKTLPPGGAPAALVAHTM